MVGGFLNFLVQKELVEVGQEEDEIKKIKVFLVNWFNAQD